MVPERFVTEYPERCMQLFKLMEPIAEHEQLIGSFSLIVATSIFLIPYERMKARHFLHDPIRETKIDIEIKRVERQKFLQGEFWDSPPNHGWRFSRIMSHVNYTDDWRDQDKIHPMDPRARNKIGQKTVNDVLRVIRNALAHGNVVYLDERGFETRGAKLVYLGFLSRYEEQEGQRSQAETYRLVVTTEHNFLHFVKSWASWLSRMPREHEFLAAAE